MPRRSFLELPPRMRRSLGLFGWEYDLATTLRKMERRLMSAIDDLRKSVADLGKKIDDYVSQNQVDIQAKIDEAIAADDAGEEVDLHALKDEVMAIANRVPPKFEPSNN